MTGLLAAITEALHLVCHFCIYGFSGDYLPGKCIKGTSPGAVFPVFTGAQRDDCEHNYNQVQSF